MSKSGKLVEVYDPNLNLCLHGGSPPPEISNTSMVSGSMLSMNALHSWYMTTRAQSVVLKPILAAISLMRRDLGNDLPIVYTSSSVATTSVAIEKFYLGALHTCAGSFPIWW